VPSKLKIKNIGTGYEHTIILLDDWQTLFSTGNNGYGQLGLGINDRKIVKFQKVPLDDILQMLPSSTEASRQIGAVKCGYWHSFLITRDGKHLLSAGRNGDGQLGIGSTTN